MKFFFRQSYIFNALKNIWIRYELFIKKNKIISINIKWRKFNQHNYTRCANGIEDNFFPFNKVSVDKYTYGPLKVYSYDSESEFLRIGSFCSIANGVKFILGGMHSYDVFSTYPFNYRFMNKKTDAYTKGPIIIEDDVWIGTDAIILSGVTIARGSIIAAGSVVVKSTEPYSVVGGNPAKLIKKRFNDTTINELVKVDFTKLNLENIKNNMNILTSPLSYEVIQDIKNRFN